MHWSFSGEPKMQSYLRTMKKTPREAKDVSIAIQGLPKPVRARITTPHVLIFRRSRYSFSNFNAGLWSWICKIPPLIFCCPFLLSSTGACMHIIGKQAHTHTHTLKSAVKRERDNREKMWAVFDFKCKWIQNSPPHLPETVCKAALKNKTSNCR